MTQQGDAANLRRLAESHLPAKLATGQAEVDDTDYRRLTHELQVHQIELEMQNNELLHARAELEVALDRYTELYEFAPVGYLTLTPDGLISMVNLTGAALLGLERINLAQKRFCSFIFAEDQDCWTRHLLNVQKIEGSSAVELRLRRGDGTFFYAQLHCVRCEASTLGVRCEGNTLGVCPAGNTLGVCPAGNTLGVRIVLTDISERKRLELERNEAKAAAESANRAKSNFLSSMSHELRTPLSTILGFAQLIESGSTPLTATQKSSIEQILHAGWYLLELVNEILDLALIESDKLSLTLIPVALSEVLHECLDMTELQAQKRGISVVLCECEIPHFVQADRTRMKQVVLNLLSNAIKYNKKDGEVEVICHETTPGRIRIEVRDTGHGLTAERMEQLFQPFNRLGQEEFAQEGTGIGLVLSKRLTELMGGSIGAESTVGKGSVFWIELSQAAEE